MSETYDGATTALRRWSRRWKALAKRARFRWAAEVIERANLQFRLDMMTADPESLSSQLLSKHNALQMASKNLDAMREKYDRDISDKEIAHQADLAAERAAHAESAAAAQRLQGEYCSERAAREQAERRVAELQAIKPLLDAEKLEELQKDYDACHRQHEQCMKLLDRCRQVGILDLDLSALVGEMLAKGELPEEPR